MRIHNAWSAEKGKYSKLFSTRWPLQYPAPISSNGFALGKAGFIYGHFDLRGIAPGDYKLFSWVEVESGAWEDPEFLRQFEEKGQRITLQDGDHSNVKVTAIQSKSPEPSNP